MLLAVVMPMKPCVAQAVQGQGLVVVHPATEAHSQLQKFVNIAWSSMRRIVATFVGSMKMGIKKKKKDPSKNTISHRAETHGKTLPGRHRGRDFE